MTMPMKPWDWRDAVYSARFTCSPNWFEATSSRRPVDSFQLIAQLPPGRQPDRQTLLATEHLPEHPLCHPLRQSIPMNRSFSCPFTTHPFLSMAQRACVSVCVCVSVRPKTRPKPLGRLLNSTLVGVASCRTSRLSPTFFMHGRGSHNPACFSDIDSAYKMWPRLFTVTCVMPQAPRDIPLQSSK